MYGRDMSTIRKDRQIVMGLRTKSPQEFNIDKKLRPQDPLILFINGERKSKSIESWIEIVPERLWDKIYKTSEYGSKYNVPAGKEVSKLSLCSNAYSLLKRVIEKLYPVRQVEVDNRIRKRIATKRVKAQLSYLSTHPS
jgi:hypothetical protein